MDTVKTGFKTSEFWLSLAGTVAALFAPGLSSGAQAVIAVALPAVYNIARAVVKAQAIKAQRLPAPPQVVTSGPTFTSGNP